MSIADVMTRELPSLGTQDTLRDSARKMRDAGVKALPVLDEDRLVGIITDWDVTRAVAEEASPSDVRVSDCMSTDLITVSPDASFMEAAERMADCQIHHLLVSEGGRFVGMVHLDVEWSELGGLEAPMATFGARI